MAKGKHEATKKTAKKTASAKKAKKKSSAKKTICIIAAVCILLAAAACGGGYLAGHSDKIHPNMTLGGVSIGDMTVAQATAALEKAGWSADADSVKVTLPGEYTFTVTAKQAGMDISCAEAAQAAYDYGHSGSIIDDLVCYFKCITGGVSQSDIMQEANADGVRAAVDKALADYNERMGKGYEVDTENAVLKMIKGAETVDIDADELCKVIIDAFAEGNDSLSYGIAPDSAEEPDFEALHEEICTEVQDAQYDPETQKATESSVGIEFDVKQAQKLWEKAENGETVKIPLTVTEPKYTAEQLDKMLFADKLGTMTTTYTSSTENRATNVELSAEKINGYILAPGETFSYNTVVGKRTAEAGFKSAGAYAGGKVVQEIGGGICQTSSTLYCAALYANLEIVARDEHGFAVSYVPWGMDATVSWGGPEFKFKNNREFPIKIVTKCENRKLTVEIWGTDVDGSYVKVENSHWTVYDTTYPSVAIGTGAVTYRCVYDKDGNLISRNKEAGSYYHYHSENIQWPTATTTPTPTATPTPSQTPEEEPAETASTDP